MGELRAKATGKRQLQAEREAAVESELKVRRAILDAVIGKGKDEITTADIRALLAVLLDHRGSYGGYNFSTEELCRRHCGLHPELKIENAKERGHIALLGALPKMADAEIRRLAVEASVMVDFVEWPTAKPEALLALAQRYKVDAARIRLDAEKAPKEAEGGTVKEVLKKLPTLDQAAKNVPAKRAAQPKTAVKKAFAGFDHPEPPDTLASRKRQARTDPRKLRRGTG